MNDSRSAGPERPRRFTTEAQAAYRRGGRRRLAWAGAVVVVGLLLLVFLGPDEKVVKEKFEYLGARSDEMVIMPDIAIEDGADRVAQMPKSLQVPPPPANMDIIEEKEDPDAVEAKPEEREADPNELDVAVENPRPDSETSEEYQVEMSLPQQTSVDFWIESIVRPSYPMLDATQADLRTPIIRVYVEFFVRPDGTVSDVLVKTNNGSKIFADVVVEAQLQWEFGWKVDPGLGRWFRQTFRFKSPYFTPGRDF